MYSRTDSRKFKTISRREAISSKRTSGESARFICPITDLWPGITSGQLFPNPGYGRVADKPPTIWRNRGTVFLKQGRCVCHRSQISRKSCPEGRPGQ
jgi:hypothetical protein